MASDNLQVMELQYYIVCAYNYYIILYFNNDGNNSIDFVFNILNN